MMGKTAQAGDTVSVDYIGKFEDGKVFDTSLEQVAKDNALFNPQRSYAPFSFTIGSGQVVAGFDTAARGMKVGETKTVTLPPEQAYGNAKPELIVTVSGSQFTDAGLTPEVGQTYQAAQGMSAVVTAISGNMVTMDYNSPMAGKTLVFEITLRQIEDKTAAK